MKIFITGICGFVGSAIATRVREAMPDAEVFGLDNLSRAGSEKNRRLAAVRIIHGDIRVASDLESLPPADWVIDAAALLSVLAGVDNRSSSRQLVEQNLFGTVNILEYCRRSHAGFILLSTSRVYAIRPLSELPPEIDGKRFVPRFSKIEVEGISSGGVSEEFSTAAPVSLYGATKLASETLALEYRDTFGIPVWVNRCGALAGARQFGTAEQGIFSFWLHAWRSRRPLRYIGFGGRGLQVRDAVHPEDLAELILRQLRNSETKSDRICNVGGGTDHSMSLLELSEWRTERFGPHQVVSDTQDRLFDIPWMVLDSSRARLVWNWDPRRSLVPYWPRSPITPKRTRTGWKGLARRQKAEDRIQKSGGRLRSTDATPQTFNFKLRTPNPVYVQNIGNTRWLRWASYSVVTNPHFSRPREKCARSADIRRG
jgi:CDP-paratose 2-epimerase